MARKIGLLVLSLTILFSYSDWVTALEQTKKSNAGLNFDSESEASSESAVKKRKPKPNAAFSVLDVDSVQSSKAYIPQAKDQLQPLSETFQLNSKENNNEFAVIGVDTRFRPGRTTQYPLTAIGRLEVFFGSSLATCSATLISPNKLITAAHCIYQKEKKAFANKIYFTPGRDGDYIPFGVYAVNAVYIPKSYPNSNFTNNNADIAVLSLATSIGNQLGYLGFGVYQPPPEQVIQTINKEFQFLAQQAVGNTALQRKKITEYMETAHTNFSDYSLSYFGYSGDKNGEVWGDTCLHFLSKNFSTEKYPLVQTFCDYQRGASGSAFIDKDRNVRGVNSFHAGGEGTALSTESGKQSGNFKGDIYSVQNYSVGISEYTYQLILNWRNDQYGEETLVRQYSNANDLKQVRIQNKCRDALWIAARYKDINGDWVNMGFYKKQPYKESVFSITSDYFYYYAQDENANRVWDGSDSYQTLYNNNYGFRKKQTSSAYESKIGLTCG